MDQTLWAFSFMSHEDEGKDEKVGLKFRGPRSGLLPYCHSLLLPYSSLLPMSTSLIYTLFVGFLFFFQHRFNQNFLPLIHYCCDAHVFVFQLFRRPKKLVFGFLGFHKFIITALKFVGFSIYHLQIMIFHFQECIF